MGDRVQVHRRGKEAITPVAGHARVVGRSVRDPTMVDVVILDRDVITDDGIRVRVGHTLTIPPSFLLPSLV